MTIHRCSAILACVALTLVTAMLCPATAADGTTLLSYEVTGVSKLVVAIGFESGFNNNSATVTGVTFNGVALTQAVQEITLGNTSYEGGTVTISYLDNPTTGVTDKWFVDVRVQQN